MENSKLGAFAAIMTIIGAIIGITYTILQYHNPVVNIPDKPIKQESEINNLPITLSPPFQVVNPTKSENQKPTKDISTKPNISEYINIPETTYDLAICFVDETNNLKSEFNNSVGKLYKSSGKTVIANLFTNKFLKSESFNNLFVGDNTIIRKLELSSYVTKIIIGRLSIETRSGTLVNESIICNINLEVNIISVNTGTILDSFFINNVSANDVTESAAKSTAIKKLIAIYNDQYLNL